VETNDAIFEDVEVGEDAILGGPQMWNQGWRQLAGRALEVEKLELSAVALGLAEAACEDAIDYASTRVQFGKPIIYRVLKATVSGEAVSVSTEGAANMLQNFSFMVDVTKAECTVESDKKILNEVTQEGKFVDNLTNVAANSLRAGATAARNQNFAVDAYACGEREAFRALPAKEAAAALKVAAAAGQLDAMNELLVTRRSDVDEAIKSGDALISACITGRTAVCVLLFRFVPYFFFKL
jgi:hypothetical protein